MSFRVLFLLRASRSRLLPPFRFLVLFVASSCLRILVFFLLLRFLVLFVASSCLRILVFFLRTSLRFMMVPILLLLLLLPPLLLGRAEWMAAA
jgi:hypothetical protein